MINQETTLIKDDLNNITIYSKNKIICFNEKTDKTEIKSNYYKIS